jgi:hypothetical protein
VILRDLLLDLLERDVRADGPDELAIENDGHGDARMRVGLPPTG